jgi:hypothetical protein
VEPRDILPELANGTMSPNDSDALYDRVMDSADAADAADAARLLGLSNVEWTSYCQGAGFEQLSTWRVAGWPTQCGVCGRAIVVESYGWLVAEIDRRLWLQHIQCPS